MDSRIIYGSKGLVAGEPRNKIKEKVLVLLLVNDKAITLVRRQGKSRNTLISCYGFFNVS